MLDSDVINWILFEVDPATLSEILDELRLDEIAGSPALTSAAADDPGLQAACLARLSGNLSARLECFRSEHGCQELLAQCVDDICAQLRQREIGTLQCLLPNHAGEQLRILPMLGFEHRADVSQLCLKTSHLPAEPPGPKAGQLCWMDHSQIDGDAWKHLLEQTLLDSQDLVGAGRPTAVVEALDLEIHHALYRGNALCRILCRGDQALGLYVLRHLKERSELVYIGIAQQHRRQRLGGLLLHQAVRSAAEFGSQYMTTAVDMKNHPARRLFAGLPFAETGGFQLWERDTTGG